MQARTANEVLKAQTARIRLQQLKESLIDRDKALNRGYMFTRLIRDTCQNWPSRVSAEIAVEFGVDAHLMHVVLEKHIRIMLLELSEMKLSF